MKLTAVFLTFRTFSSLAAEAWTFLCSFSDRRKSNQISMMHMVHGDGVDVHYMNGWINGEGQCGHASAKVLKMNCLIQECTYSGSS